MWWLQHFCTVYRVVYKLMAIFTFREKISIKPHVEALVYAEVH